MNHVITVYSIDTCKFCVNLLKWLAKNNITYINKNIRDQDTFYELNKFNVNGVPFIRIVDKETNEEERIVGFQPEKLKEILKI